MTMPQLTDAHRKLEKITGTWLGQETIHPSPMDPQGGPAIGRVSNRMALDGFAVVQDYEQERGGRVPFRGHGVFRYDAHSQQYVLHWFDSLGFPPGEFRGTFDGDVMILTMYAPQGSSRATFDFRQPAAYQFTMEVSPDGQQWFPFLGGTYQRQD